MTNIISLEPHAPIDHFRVQSGCLCIGDRQVTSLAEELGTPFYAYDGLAIRQRVDTLRAALPERIHLHYAMKANPMPAVVKLLSTLTNGLDVASAGELEVALATPTRPGDISFAGPGKQISELSAAIAAGITINLESETELNRVIDLSQTTGRKAHVAVRVNPDFQLKTSGMKMGGGPQPFGIDAELVPALLNRIVASDLHFRGFHIFSGSQNLNHEFVIEANNQTFALADRLAEPLDTPPELLNIGGGLGIPYFPNETPIDLAPISRNLQRLLMQHTRFLETEIVMELGRFLVGEAGVYVCRVIDKKVSRGHTFLVTDGGLHHHLSASGNFGQVLRKNYPVTVANKIGSGPTETVSVVGPLCTPLDLLGNKMLLPQAEIGDLVAVFCSGAYGRTASPLGFLSHPSPKEILIDSQSLSSS